MRRISILLQKYHHQFVDGLKTFNFSSRTKTIIQNRSMSQNENQIKFLSQNEAINLDKELFDEYAFSVDQLMELAGLSVATAVARTYPLAEFDKPIICCGPGNNGGDGLVCGRHLKLFGYSPIIVCPKLGRGQLFVNLVTQCKKFQIPFLDQVPEQPLAEMGNLLIDSVFGFSFNPPNRNPDFAKLLNQMHKYSSTMPLISVDIPSGWHVEKGYSDIEQDQADIEQNLRIPALQPDCLISLTAPKLCARNFNGRYHYLGGRFCPKSIIDKYKLNMPEYPAQDGVLRLK